MTELVQPVRRAAPDAPLYRDAMARVASAVHIVTTVGPGGRIGLTATAVASVSDTPPTVLVSIARPSRTLAVIEASGVFCINTLPGGCEDLAEIFASRRGIDGEARFASRHWSSLATGAPVLAEAVAAFDCRLVAAHDIATHRVLIGEVVGLGGAGAQPAGATSLIYRGRRFEAV
ncbi:MAG TPA: flavin reductase family protein [Bosea sp. (in: a-proteobacteria)]|jgi:flavin reductase (DIM6/NTAB) family NADH-FMN oxidoreductase RutF|uniref:flavin reductase family protein n=1 Tax=Bosea sp. (in: a-proteobacteria) TaxID=1871050 RepID=UPI002E0D9930|nr:flavin reductase family protein [Bosea sp. (in: a-proteobacteria)]